MSLYDGRFDVRARNSLVGTVDDDHLLPLHPFVGISILFVVEPPMWAVRVTYLVGARVIGFQDLVYNFVAVLQNMPCYHAWTFGKIVG